MLRFCFPKCFPTHLYIKLFLSVIVLWELEPSNDINVFMQNVR